MSGWFALWLGYQAWAALQHGLSIGLVYGFLSLAVGSFCLAVQVPGDPELPEVLRRTVAPFKFLARTLLRWTSGTYSALTRPDTARFRKLIVNGVPLLLTVAFLAGVPRYFLEQRYRAVRAEVERDPYGNRETLDRLLSASPNDPVLLSLRASTQGPAERRIQSLSAVIAKHPELAHAYLQRGLAYVDEAKSLRALTDFETWERLTEEEPPDALLQGRLRAYRQLARHRDEARILKQLLERKPGDREYQEQLLDTLLDAHLYEEAEPLSAALIEQTPGDDDIHMYRAVALHGLGRYRESIEHDNVLIERVRLLAWAYTHRGYNHLVLGELDKSEADYRKALSFNHRNDLAIGNLLRLMERQGRQAEATAFGEEAAAAEPNWAYPYQRLAWLHYDRGDFAGALAYADKAIAREATAENYALRARVRHGDLEGALEDCRRAEEALAAGKAGDASRMQLKSLRLAFSLRLDEEKELRRTLQRSRSATTARELAERAAAHVELRDWEAALADCEAALAAGADEKDELYRRQAWCLGNLGRYREGLASLDTAPDDPELRGYLLVGLGRYAEAVDAYTQAIAKRPTGAAYLGRSRAHRKLKNWRQELEDYLKGTELDPRVREHPRWK